MPPSRYFEAIIEGNIVFDLGRLPPTVVFAAYFVENGQGHLFMKMKDVMTKTQAKYTVYDAGYAASIKVATRKTFEDDYVPRKTHMTLRGSWENTNKVIHKSTIGDMIFVRSDAKGRKPLCPICDSVIDDNVQYIRLPQAAVLVSGCNAPDDIIIHVSIHLTCVPKNVWAILEQNGGVWDPWHPIPIDTEMPPAITNQMVGWKRSLDEINNQIEVLSEKKRALAKDFQKSTMEWFTS